MVEMQSLNLSEVGRMGGSEHTNWRKFFSSEEAAMKFAEADFAAKIAWRRDGERISSGDLRYVMYLITTVTVVA